MSNHIHLANSARGFIKALKETRITIAAVIEDWNTCVVQSGDSRFDFPTKGYTRKAQLIADLQRCAEQLENMAIDADRKAGRPVDEEGNDMREFSGNSIAADHAEALIDNLIFDERKHVYGPHWWFDRLNAESQALLINVAHTEALTINEEMTMTNLSIKELAARTKDVRLAPEFRLSAQREITRRRNAEPRKTWKQKLGVCLFIGAGLILGGHADASTQRFTCGPHEVVYQFPLAATNHDHDTLTVDGKQYVYPVEISTGMFDPDHMIARSDIGGKAVALYLGGGEALFAVSDLNNSTRWVACK